MNVSLPYFVGTQRNAQQPASIKVERPVSRVRQSLWVKFTRWLLAKA